MHVILIQDLRKTREKVLFYFLLTVMEVTSADCYRKISETVMFQEYKKITLQIPREH
jgi:hypothetical protein